MTALDKIKTGKPVFLKISADLSNKEIDHIITFAMRRRVTGFICANLTENYTNKFRQGSEVKRARKEFDDFFALQY